MRLVGPLLLVWTLWRFGDEVRTLGSALGRASLVPLLVALLLNGFAIHAKLWRWKSLLGACGARIDAMNAYRAYMPSIFLAWVTPGRIGDLVRIQYLKQKHDVPYARGLAVSVVDRLCDVYVLLAFVSLGFLHLSSALPEALRRIAWLPVVAVALAPLIKLAPSIVEPAVRWLYERLSRRESSESPGVFFDALRDQLGPALLVPLLSTTLAFLINYLQGWLVAYAFGMSLSFPDVVAALAMSSLLSLLPISIAGVGVREAFFALIFPPAFGLDQAAGVLFGLGAFGIIYLPVIVLGFIAWQVWPPPR